LVASRISREYISRRRRRRQRRIEGKERATRGEICLYGFDYSGIRSRCKSDLTVVVITVAFGGKRKQFVDRASSLYNVCFGKTGFDQSAARVKERIRTSRLQNHRRKLHAQVSRAGIDGELRR